MEAEMNELKNKLNALADNTPSTNVMCEMTLCELL
jgi:hypothetical protein